MSGSTTTESVFTEFVSDAVLYAAQLNTALNAILAVAQGAVTTATEAETTAATAAENATSATSAAAAAAASAASAATAAAAAESSGSGASAAVATLTTSLDALEAQITAVQTTANDALPVAGGSMTGPLILSGNPTAELGASTKEYSDAGDAANATAAANALAAANAANTTANSAITTANEALVAANAAAASATANVRPSFITIAATAQPFGTAELAWLAQSSGAGVVANSGVTVTDHANGPASIASSPNAGWAALGWLLPASGTAWTVKSQMRMLGDRESNNAFGILMGVPGGDWIFHAFGLAGSVYTNGLKTEVGTIVFNNDLSTAIGSANFTGRDNVPVPYAPEYWLAIQDDGVLLHFGWSFDNVDWQWIGSCSNTIYVTSTVVGVCSYAADSVSLTPNSVTQVLNLLTSQT